MGKYEKKLRRMQVFYEEYAGLVGFNRDLAINLNQMVKTVGKPLACKLIDGLTAHIKRDIKDIKKYSREYEPEMPQSVNTAAEASEADEKAESNANPSKELQAVNSDSLLNVSESVATTQENPPQ